MKTRPLGWELVCFFVILAGLIVGLVTNWLPLVVLALAAAAIVTPVVIVSFLVRLIVGIVDEDRRVRTLRAASGR